MAFPEDRLDLRAELELGGERVDITSRVYTRDPITITAGMSAEGRQVDPSTCTLTLDNSDGALSPRNALGPWYGRLGRNVPLRVTVPYGESYLDLSGADSAQAWTPDHASLDHTSELDVRIEATAPWGALDQTSRTLIGKWDTTGQKSWALFVLDRDLILEHTPNGAASRFDIAPLPLADLPPRCALRATLYTNNGSSGRTVRFYWAETMAGPWTIFATLVTPGTGSIHSGTSRLIVGPTDGTWTPIRGRVHRAEVRSTVGGTVVAAPDFRAAPPGAATVVDSTGKTWTIAGAGRISDRESLFTGEISSWPARWATSGQTAWVPAQASGVLRRLGQGRKPLQSTLRRRIPSEPDCVAYWPMEDGNLARQAAAGLPGLAPLRTTGLSYASADGLPGSASLPQLASAPASVNGRTLDHANTGEWMVAFIYKMDSLPSSPAEFLEFTTTGTMRRIRLTVEPGVLRLYGYDSEGEEILSHAFSPITDFAGAWTRFEIHARTTGSSVKFHIGWLRVGGTGYATDTTVTATAGRVTSVTTTFGSGLTGMALGHLMVLKAADTSVYDGIAAAFAGESAALRLHRLAAEEPNTAPVTVMDGDTSLGTELMGPQRIRTMRDLLAECADVDGGILAERPDALGLVYRDRTTLYNQRPTVTLDYAAGHIAPPLEPTDDDQHVRNDITVTRDGGSSSRVVIEDGPLGARPPEDGGVGIYDEEITLNLATDEQAVQHAGWRAHIGTWDAPRFPSVRILLHRHPQLIPAVLRLRIGDRIRLTGLPAEAGGTGEPIDLHVQQITHTPRPRTWDVVLVCTPAGPWTVGVAGAAGTRADTAGCHLATPIGADDDTLSITTTVGPRWITSAESATDFPIDLRIGGEVVRVTTITGSGATQTATVVRAVNGIRKPHAAGASIRLAHPTTVAL